MKETKMLRPCCLGTSVEDSIGRVDGLLWYKNLGHHVFGDFSMATIQANRSLEDQSQLESGPLFSTNSGPQAGTFVGVYDGHGGPEAAQFVSNNLLYHLKTIATSYQQMSEDIIRKAFAATEEDFLSLVRKKWLVQPHMASVGTCCLVGLICDGHLYIANAGDSRVVLGRLRYGDRKVSAVQLSVEHNANIHSVREELSALHPNDKQIVVKKHNTWRVKGIIQVSRSIGDAYLKKAEFNKEPLPPKFRLPETFFKPILSSEPSISVHRLLPQDQFLIFASDGLWEHLTNQEAVDIVQSSPRNGISRRLIIAALQEAARKREMRYSDLQKIDQGVKRHFHDDITVIVVFIDYSKLSHGSSNICGPSMSIKASASIFTPPIS